MSYKRKIYRFKNVIEIMDYHSARYGAPGQERQKKKKATPEQVDRRNQWNRETLARHRLLEHFGENDYFTLLTWRKEDRPPDMKTAQKWFRNFKNVIKREYAKRGYELKWMRNIEVGTKNGWHIHMVINRIPDTDIILQKAWRYGKAVSQLLYEKGGFAELAAYITKTPKTDPRLKDTHYSHSRNLPVPEPEVILYKRWKTWDKEKLRVPKGYYVDPDSFHEGINPVTGYPYRRYMALRLPGKKTGKPEKHTKRKTEKSVRKRRVARERGDNQGRDAPGGE